MPQYHYISHSFSGTTLSLAEREGKLVACLFGNNFNNLQSYVQRHEKHAELKKALEPFKEAIEQLDEYFAGERRTFNIPMTPYGTEFQRAVWKQLVKIPYGKTSSYGDIARALGDANFARAAGGAIGKNPLSIIIPCHRVIGANGAMTGFGGGIPIKKRLLTLEGVEIN